MILRTTVALEKMPPEVVIAPAGAVPAFITSADVGSVIANAETTPRRSLSAVTRRSPAETTELPVVTVRPVPAVMVVVEAMDDGDVIAPVTVKAEADAWATF